MAPPRRRNDQTRVVLLIAALVAVVAVIGVVVALVVGGDDDGGDEDENAFHPVTVEGDPLPPFESGSADDPAVGMAVPVLSGDDYVGNQVVIDPAADGPTMVVFLAHWCPHCAAEIPVLNEWRDSGEVPEGLNIVGVSTGVTTGQPEFPPDQWLAEADWEWPVLADDRAVADGVPWGPAMVAYGGQGTPTMVFVDGDGRVFQRLSGEVPIEVIDPLVDELVAASSA
jgi:thiol-disulfide isomerase/thioredoxin